jgi:hypothetical protein
MTGPEGLLRPAGFGSPDSRQGGHSLPTTEISRNTAQTRSVLPDEHMDQ